MPAFRMRSPHETMPLARRLKDYQGTVSLSDPASGAKSELIEFNKPPPLLTPEEERSLFEVIRASQEAFFHLTAIDLPPAIAQQIEQETKTALIAFAPKDISHPVVSKESESAESLLEALNQGKLAYQLLLLSYLPMALRTISRIKWKGGLDSGELFSLLFEGLMKATARYNPSIGAAFSTYAIPIMKYTVVDELRAQGFLPRSVIERISDIMSAQKDLEAEGYQGDLTEQIADRLGLSTHQITQALSASASLQRVSLDAPYDVGIDGEDITLSDIIPDSNSLDPSDSIIRQEEYEEDKKAQEKIQMAFASLPEREQFIIDLYYRGVATLKELGPLVGVSETRVSQILKSGISTLRSLLTP